MATDPNSDPANVAAVSGFYGPGAWTAYICSLTSAWYTLLFRPEASGSSDLIVSLLYANWAAIDLLLHVTSKDPKTSYASVAAASTITMWALEQIVMQIAICAIMTPLSQPTKRRLYLCVAGVLVPSIAAVWLIWDMFIAKVPHSLPPGLHGSDLETWYDGLDEDVSVVFGFNFYAAILVFVCNKVWSVRPGLRALLCSWGFSGLYALALYFGYQHSPNFIRACAPQGISEPDQAFALLCGLTALVYQVGSDAWLRTTAIWYGMENHHYELLRTEEGRSGRA